MPEPTGIDPRGPRFAASITATLLLIDIFLALTGPSAARTESGGWVLTGLTLTQRASDPAFVLLAVITALFAWGVLSPRTAVWGVLFRRVIQPRLAPTAEREDPRPPRFAQGVGLAVAATGLVLQLAGVPYGLALAASAAFTAAFLNAAFNYCLGCQMYLGMRRLSGRKTHSVAS